MSSAAETIKERLGIVEVISSYIKVEKAGSNYKARCPFHNEKTPSFFISPARANYYCFGCQAKGDIFSFVQEFEKVDFIGALKLLAERAGIELEQFKGENKNKGEFDRLRAVLETSTSYYENQLKKNIEALQYLKDRGLTGKTIEQWRVGFAPNEWRSVHDFLISKKISESDMEAVGLIKHSEKSDTASIQSAQLAQGSASQFGNQRSTYDRFRSRIVFPLFDPSSRVIGYSGRIFGPDQENAPKYLNSPDTVLFNKSEVLYGYNKARDGIRQWKYAILVEGQMDLLMCHQIGFTNAVATSGTALTTMHLEKIKRLSDNILLVYDADKAGLKATLRAWTAALALGMDVKVSALPKGEDPASLILKDKEAFKTALKKSKHIIEYYLDILETEYALDISEGDSVKFKKAVESEVLPYVAVIDSAIERSNFISKISVQTGISEPDIRTETDKLITQSGQENAQGVAKKSVTSSTVQGASGDTYTKNNKLGSISGLLNDTTAKRLAALISWLRTKKDTQKADSITEKLKHIVESEKERADFEEYVQKHGEELVFEAEVLFDGSSKIDEEIEQLIAGLEENILKSNLLKTMNELHIAEQKKDVHRKIELENTLKDLLPKLSDIHKRKQK